MNKIVLLITLTFQFLLISLHLHGQSNINNFPIIAWNGVPEAETSVFRYKELKDAGFNVNHVGFNSLEKALKALDIAQQVGIKLLLNCPEMYKNTEATVKLLKNHPALLGYFISDEPSLKQFPTITRVINNIRKVDKVKICYVNLFPNYASSSDLGTYSYSSYLDNFYNNFKLRVYSFDNYPIYQGSIRPNWFSNLDEFRMRSYKENADFWAFTLTTPYRSSSQVINLEDIRLQVFSNLAYGAQGIQFFTYWTPQSNGNHKFYSGPISKNGQKTKYYEYSKIVNSEIKSLLPIFYKSKINSIYHTNKERGTKIYNDNFNSIFNIVSLNDAKLILSNISNGKRNYMAIINKDLKNLAKIKIVPQRDIILITKYGDRKMLKKSLPSDIQISQGDIVIFEV